MFPSELRLFIHLSNNYYCCVCVGGGGGGVFSSIAEGRSTIKYKSLNPSDSGKTRTHTFIGGECMRIKEHTDDRRNKTTERETQSNLLRCSIKRGKEREEKHYMLLNFTFANKHRQTSRNSLVLTKHQTICYWNLIRFFSAKTADHFLSLKKK